MIKISTLYLEKNDAENAACAFLLNDKPIKSKREEIGKWIVEVKKNNPFVVARTIENVSEKKFVQIAHDAIQKFLDIYFFTFGQALCSDKSTDEAIVYYKKPDKKYLKIIDNSYLTLNFGGKVVITDKNGKVIKQKVEPLSHYNFMRYFRISQATDDIFESFRYMFLSFENLLSSKYSKDTFINEEKWFKSCLKDLDEKYDLSKSLKVKSISTHFYQNIYKNIRCEIFHSKNWEIKYLPYDLNIRQLLLEGIDFLSYLISVCPKNSLLKTLPTIITHSVTIFRQEKMGSSLRLTLINFEQGSTVDLTPLNHCASTTTVTDKLMGKVVGKP